VGEKKAGQNGQHGRSVDKEKKKTKTRWCGKESRRQKMKMFEENIAKKSVMKTNPDGRGETIPRQFKKGSKK